MISFAPPVVAWHDNADAAAPFVVLFHGRGSDRAPVAPVQVDDAARSDPAKRSGTLPSLEVLELGEQFAESPKVPAGPWSPVRSA